MSHIRRFIYLITFCLAIFSGTHLQFNGVFLQGYLFILSSLVYPAITYRTLLAFSGANILLLCLFAVSIFVTAIFALDPAAHIIAAIRLFSIMVSSVTFYGIYNRDPKLVDLIYSILIMGTGSLALFALVGIDFGFEVGERFGFVRPFLYANPITIGLMISLIAIYYLITKKRLFAAFAIPLSLVFSSATGLFSLILFYSRNLLLFIIVLIFGSIFLGYQEEVGSLITRINIFIYTASLLSLLTFDQFLFGVGFRGLDLWNMDHYVLIISNDLTIFLRFFFELGVFGVFLVCIICFRVIRYDHILGAILLIILLSIDQLAQYWILHFYVILFGLRRVKI